MDHSVKKGILHWNDDSFRALVALCNAFLHRLRPGGFVPNHLHYFTSANKTDQKLLINFWLIKDRLRKKIQTYPLSELSVLVAGPLEMWGCGWSDVTLVYVTTHITFFGLKPEKSKMYSWKGEKLLSGYLIERKKSIHRQSYSACQLTISLEKDFSSV